MFVKLSLYLSFLTFSLCMLSYDGMANKYGWSKGSKIDMITFIGGILFFGGIIESFFEFKWWIVLIGFFASQIFGATFTSILKNKTQIVAPVLTIVSLIGIVVYKTIIANGL